MSEFTVPKVADGRATSDAYDKNLIASTTQEAVKLIFKNELTPPEAAAMVAGLMKMITVSTNISLGELINVFEKTVFRQETIQ